MKKFLTILIVVSLLVSSSVLFSNAATASDVKAKFGATTIDGVISEGEYGTKYVFSKDTSTPFADNEIDPLPYNYYINWTEDALYCAYEATLAASDWGTFNPQFNFNPWNVIPSGKNLQGLFFKITFKSETEVGFQIHNHDTVAVQGGDGNKAAVIPNVEYSIKTTDGVTVVEFKLPVDLFRIKSDASEIDASDKKFEAGQEFGFSAFLVYADKGWGQTTSDYSKWEVENIGLGKIALEAEPTPEPTAEPTPEKTEAPADEEDEGGLSTGAILGIVIGVVIVAAVVIYFVTKKKD